jgi:hypothetical protein
MRLKNKKTFPSVLNLNHDLEHYQKSKCCRIDPFKELIFFIFIVYQKFPNNQSIH